MTVRLFEEVYNSIRRDLIRGALKPGDKLPSERVLADKLGVGRPVVREALRALENSGVLEFRKGATGGAFIRDGDGRAVSRTVNDLVFLGKLSLDQLAEARTHLLNLAVKLACERSQPADVEALEENIERMRLALEDEDVVSSIDEIMAFYALLGTAAKNDVLTVLIESLSDIISQILLSLRPDYLSELVAMRLELVCHIKNRDVQAAEAAMSAHMDVLHNYVMERSLGLHSLNLDPIYRGMKGT
ncbi:FadR/GntR family transcriptional regulator [Henriciella aquimarina]|uniref:FadR/GntR family transcriptional regulator n=1 Tax=Henriciella aquimarina TaxID=545261 RepID=UPI0009FBB7C1|nr:GntR family transcriptional regulator [Henriciella aquimarina]